MGNGAFFKFDIVFDEITTFDIRFMFWKYIRVPIQKRNDSKYPSPIFPFKIFISGKTDLSDSSSYDEGRSGKFEQLDFQKSPWSLFSIPLNMIQPHVLQWSCVHWSHCVMRGQSLPLQVSQDTNGTENRCSIPLLLLMQYS